MRLVTPVLLVAALAVSAGGAPLFAQQKTTPVPASAAKAGTAAITGVVVDSLNGRYLRGADVIIEGAKTSLVTDSLGKFRIDSLPPGTYQVGVFHPLLDTLGISLASRPFHIGPD
ncbi:MAG TPA: carboxypeptidase regulatory-like domain-containing protein, partial [Gemmatimonadaceae bacterium]